MDQSEEARAKKERQDVVKHIVKVLLDSDEVDLKALAAEAEAKGVGSIQFSLAQHEAREILREKHRIDFAPVHGRGGVVHRANLDQLKNRSKRGRVAGIKKLERASDRMDIAAATSPPRDKERLEKKAASQRTQVLFVKESGRRLRDLLDSK